MGNEVKESQWDPDVNGLHEDRHESLIVGYCGSFGEILLGNGLIYDYMQYVGICRDSAYFRRMLELES